MSQVAAGLSRAGSEPWVVAPRIGEYQTFDDAAPYGVVRYHVLRQKALAMLAILPAYISASLRARDRSVIASIWWPPGFAIALLPRWLRGRFIVLAYGSEIAPSRGGLRRQAMRFVYRRADAVLAISDYTETLLASVGVVSKVTRVPLAVDVDPIEPRRASSPTILSVGRLVTRKGFDRMLDAVAKLLTPYPDLRYIIVGAGPQRDELERRVRDLGLTASVTFAGKVSDTTLRDFYAEAWVFALPARRIVDDVEGFGLVYLEAAMAELPSIGGIDSGAGDAIVDGMTGLLVDGDDVSEIAAALERLLANPNLRENMGLAARERATTFTWTRTTDVLRAHLQQPR
jgi:phosphatidylinositol alpha-1,6-mannosyltransferase